MTIAADQIGPGRVRLRIEDEMTIYTAAAMKDGLLQPLAVCTEMEIDLSQVGEMDSAGFQLLLLAKREAQRLEKTLRLTCHSRAVLDVLDTCNMASFFGDPVVIPSGTAN